MKKYLIGLLAISLIIFLGFMPAVFAAKTFDVDTSGTLTTNLQAWYNFENINDEYSTNHLTNNNSIVFDGGKINYAADAGASNTNKWLNVSTNMGIDGGVISMSGWINITTLPASGNWNAFWELSSANTKTGYGVALYNNTGNYEWRFFRERVGIATDYTSYATTTNIGSWYHLLLTYDGSNMRGYLNGNLVAGPTAMSGNGNYAGTVNNFGVFSFAATGSWSQGGSGLVDLLGVWNKTLSSTEISNLYNSGNGNAYREPPTVIGSGTANRLAKFVSTAEIGNSLFSDDGTNMTLTSGNLLVNNKILTGMGLDALSGGVLNLGITNASSVQIGQSTSTTYLSGAISWGKASTAFNCSSASSPASCGSASAGSVALPVSNTALTVSSTAVTANSQIFVMEDASLGSKLGITCSVTDSRIYSITNRTAGLSFGISSNKAPTGNPACLSYFIVN